MKKIATFSILTILLVLSIQQISFGEEKEEREEAVKEAHEVFKRDIPVNDEEVIEEAVEEKEVRKIPSKLMKLLPTEKELEEITLRTIWKYADKQSNLDEEVSIETTTALLRDITRVYDPIVNKYKVPTILIEIIKYDDIYEFEYYWDEISSASIEDIFNNAYLIGSPSENIDCMFNHSTEGAITICKTSEYVVQSIIFDKYQEHFSYNKLKVGPKKLLLTQDEMTTRIVEQVLKNIENNKDTEKKYQLYKILESNREIKEEQVKDNQKEEEETREMINQNHMKQKQNEKDKKYGIQNFSCIKDEFGLITISGQFNNNQIKKDKIILEILFLDYKQNIIFKNSANLLNIEEYETKRFLGNAKIDKTFATCTIKVDN